MSQFVEVLAKVDQAGGTIVVRDQEVRLRLRPGTLTDQDREILAQHKPDLLDMFGTVDVDRTTPHSGKTGVVSTSAAAADQDQEPPVEDLDQWLKENTVVLPPCETCGGSDFWQDLSERWRCTKCEPPIRARRTRERAARLRDSYTNRRQRNG